MITRLLTLIFIVTLAMPVTALTLPAESSQPPWSSSAVAAKGKKHKKHARKNDSTPVTAPQFTTVTRPVRGTVTRTFSGSPIRTPSFGMASPYPTEMAVSGFANGTITDVDLILHDVRHGRPADVDVLLSASDGRRALVMSDVGEAPTEREIDLTLDDEAVVSMPVHKLSSGTFRPTDVNANDDTFAAPAPAPDGGVALSTFDGADPNGTWQMWVTDNVTGQGGDIGGGWELRITAEVDLATVEEQVPMVSNSIQDARAKKKGKGKRHH